MACEREQSAPGATVERPVRVAVAANFLSSGRRLADLYAERTGHALELVAGSSGQLAAQIEQGAPFDLFLAADDGHPRHLEAGGRAVAKSRRTYALGRLALACASHASGICVQLRSQSWEPGGKLWRTLGALDRLALADPAVAPYGAAAQEVLTALGWTRPSSVERGSRQPELVLGQDVGQTYQYIATGNVSVGFVALSQVRSLGLRVDDEQERLAFVEVPEELHSPLRQQLLLLADGEAAGGFARFITGDAAALQVIEDEGYSLPSEPPWLLMEAGGAP